MLIDRMSRSAIRAVLVLAGALAGARAEAGVGVWTTGWPASAGEGAPAGMVTDPQTPGVLYAGSGRGVFKSSDNGATWVLAGLGGLSTRPLAVAPPATVYVNGTAGNGVSTLYSSTDGGDHWSAMGAGVSDLVVAPFSPTTLYRADDTQRGGRLSRSTDAGATWIEIDSGLDLQLRPISKIAADPNASGTLYVSGLNAAARIPSGFLWKTVDSGSSWTLLSSALGPVPAIAVDPTTSSIVYTASLFTVYTGAPGGVSKSVDGGTTFAQSGAGLANMSAIGLCIDPRRPNRLYVVLDSQGVFASGDAGATWHAMNAGLPAVNGGVISSGALAIDPSGTHLHVATNLGVFDYEVDPGALALNPAHPFTVTLSAINPHTGLAAPGVATQVNDLWGYFSIPAITNNPNNPEVFVKLLDGTALNGRYWFFYGGLTDLEYTLTVKDDTTGQQKTYTKPAGSECGGSDTAAFTP